MIVLVFAAVWLGMAKLFRFSSLAALAAAVAVPIALYLYGRPDGIAVRGDVADHHSQAPREHPPPFSPAPRAASGTRADVCRRAKGDAASPSPTARGSTGCG
jgi:hypothetical protein